ncbi:shikimate dehydrogenase [Methanocella sp. MCL-LM]|uniref:shikimate dehydrogenase n=1 Tax=Methanocella sp. MCL-LM TaxID=3412035 RepID=UPI003C725D44
MMTIYGVVGYPVEHSLSPVMHNAAFKALDMDCAYHKFEVKGEHLQDAILGARHLGFGGLNVTIPHKEAAIRIIEPDRTALEIGAANTLDFRQMKAFNTDAAGAIDALRDSGVELDNKGVLVLGAGGAARAVVYGLAKAGATVTIANRTTAKAADLAAYMRSFGSVFGTSLDSLGEKVRAVDVIINTTPVGMGWEDKPMVTRDMLDRSQTVFDLVYKPLETPLLREARAAGARTVDGLSMLARQGARSFEIWTGVKPPVDIMERSARDAL